MWLTLAAALAALRPAVAHGVAGVTASCDRDSLAVTLKMEQPFRGLVFSKAFARECQAQGNKQTAVSLRLPSNACGVRVSENGTDGAGEPRLEYSVALVVQMDRKLQQATDQELLVRCKLQQDALRINSSALESIMQSNETQAPEARKARRGRMRQGWSGSGAEGGRNARAWMSVGAAGRPGGAGTEPASVDVGQPTALRVHCTLPADIGFRIINCLAHDGLGEASQSLLDESGCPIDETIFKKPAIHQHSRPSEIDFKDLEPVDPLKNMETNADLKSELDDSKVRNLLIHHEAVTQFAAFKFPDRARLHITCGVELCKGVCPDIDCEMLKKPQKIRNGLVRKARLDKQAKGAVIDRLEVFNSIEVIAPNIELDDDASVRGSRRLDRDKSRFVRGFSPGDRTICFSPGKVALAFCGLGVIFLGAVVVAFVSLVRARRRLGREPLHTSLSFYTGSKSLFSSSGSSSSGLSGSKLLLTDSPYLDQHSSSSNNWPCNRNY